ncbi:MAG TPA: lysylphosphatidylglycerol synthase transmembrane domain-containing protein [Acidimicrobiales bacterium]|nr:lysylphosphatidylglycerol synthase transmembrane domain-containing protein [Acidimicrobiales bacterium]
MSVLLLAVGVGVAVSRRGQIGQAFSRLGHPAWGWLLVAVVFQASSMVAFARLQRWLLRCGGIRVRLRDMVEITLAGNALSTSIPGGAAFAAGWIWGQLRRRSVDRVLAGWVVLVAGALASFALFLYVVAGAFLAGSRGPVAPLRWLGVALLAVAVAALAGVVAVARSPRLQRRWAARVAAADRARGWRPWLVRAVDGFSARVRVVTPSPAAWLEALALAGWNWGADLATLVFTIYAVHADVPWRGVVIAYALTQISASIPITPGGLAVVEASLTALLTAYGMPATTAVTVVLLYRIISFWSLVPIGWASWGWLEWAGRNGGSGRHHPWAFHRHGGGVERRHRSGPERLRATRDCEGCPAPGDRIDLDAPTVAATDA